MGTGIPTRLSPREGRRFAFTVGIAFLGFAALLFFWRHREIPAGIAGGLGALLVMAGAVIPTHLGPLERAWMGLAHAISKVTTPIFMGVVFFGVITPIGILMRLLGKNPLVHRQEDESYWATRESGAHSDMERQF